METVMLHRKRHRRVADEDRKRAARACDRCKARKSKCIELTPGTCQRCSTAHLSCRFSQYSLRPPTTQSKPVTTFDLSQRLSQHVVVDQMRRTPWPSILARLRDAFSLDPQTAPEGQDMVTMQTTADRRALHSSDRTRLRVAIEAFPPPSIAKFLLSVFINHATDTFFYGDQAQFLFEVDQFYTNLASPLRLDPTFVCVALAAFALGSQWTPLERPDGVANDINTDDDLGWEFYCHAKGFLSDIIDRPCLRSVQASFILGVYLMPARAIGSSYVYMGLALRLALACELHQEPDDPAIGPKEQEIRRRLWWSVYSLERCTTVKLNKPRSISPEIVTVSLPSSFKDLDSNQQFDNLRFQKAYAKLIQILDRIAERGETSHLDDVDGFVQWPSDLRDWKKESLINLNCIDPLDPTYRPVFHLYLNYYFAWITMGKAALVTSVRSRIRERLCTDSQSLHIDSSIPPSAKSCTKAAWKLLQLFDNLNRRRKIARFSFTDFQGCSIATIITLVAGILERDTGYHARVNVGFDCLRQMSTGNLTAAMGVKFVEAIQSISDEAAEKLSRAPTASSVPCHPTGSRATEYLEWAKWATRGDVMSSPMNEIPDWPSTQAAPIQFGLGQDSMAGLHSPMPETDIFPAMRNGDTTFMMELIGLDVLDL
ncbi:fungal-specific transcription factor domain-containing protein [Aspergillus avenaceus]|uniref:Fungal-specific transcription factor domain-containing protein n=1 Tax=Aspergillus avenaceus TaxID=36643 RepID=A0A5N6TJN4_ASPAV|nr:fungal-specific transcription factor domain-containing protein [Aspergillus avenaceus]